MNLDNGFRHRLYRVVFRDRERVTHWSVHDSATKTACGRDAKDGASLIRVDNLDPRDTCAHCLARKDDAELGVAGNSFGTAQRVASQRRWDNRGKNY